MSAHGPALVAATLGAGGALACERGAFHFAPSLRVPVVDTTSAGDLFHAGCLYGLLQGWDVPRSLGFAAAAAALECTGLGGRAAIPSLERVLDLGERATPNSR
jgi:sulfofructose kinase